MRTATYLLRCPCMAQICTDGINCKRRVCFFAHLESEVRKRDDSAQLSTQPDMAAGAVTCLHALCVLLHPPFHPSMVGRCL